MFNRKAADAAPERNALPAGFDDEQSPVYIPEPLRATWLKTELPTLPSSRVREVMRSLARDELYERMLPRFPDVLARQQEIERAAAAPAVTVGEKGPSALGPAFPAVTEARARLREAVGAGLQDYMDEHEDTLRQRARHLLHLEHVGRLYESEQQAIAAREAVQRRLRCRQCGEANRAYGEPTVYNLLTGLPTSSHPSALTIGPCCLACAQVARENAVARLGARIVPGDGQGAPFDTRDAIAERLVSEALG